MNTSGVKPIGYRVLVKPDEVEKVTEGGIIIPENSADQYGRAQVVGTFIEGGDAAWQEYAAPWASPGDKVMFAKYGGIQFTGEDGATYRLLNDDHITAVVTGDVDMIDFKPRKKHV